MIKIVIYGIHGRMGSNLCSVIKNDDRFKILYGVDPFNEEAIDFIPVFSSFPELDCPEVIIDFSHPSQITKILDFATSHGVALVIATTGYTEEELERIKEASTLVPIFYSANFSVGIHVLKLILKQITPLLEDYDIEIIEKHHRSKLDAPSGTAKLLADVIFKSASKKYEITNGRVGECKRKENEIGIHAIRGGTITGEHSVIFAGNDEVITISHQAGSKAVFVYGAIKAALFINQKVPRLYTMDDLLS